MLKILPVSAQRIQPELLSGENLHWAGMPDPKIIFHSDDWQMIPFSAIWLGFFVFWEGSAAGFWKSTSKSGSPDTFMVLWGVPFLLIGNYMLWGRFLHDAWLKRRTHYAVTNRRVIVVQDAWNTTIATAFLESIPSIEQEGSMTGTLWFGPKLPLLGSRGSKKRSPSRFDVSDVPVFADIQDVDTVHRLVLDLREQTNRPREAGGPLTYPGFDT